MNDTFGTITQPFNMNTIKEKNTCILELVIFMRRDIKTQQKLSDY